MRARQQLLTRTRNVDIVRGARQERVENAAEQLVLLQELVLVETLRVAQLPELHGLGDDRDVTSHREGRILQIVSDAVDEQRHVVEKLLAWKYAVRMQRHACSDPIEPSPWEVVRRAAQSRRQVGGERTVRNHLHRDLSSI